MIDVTNFSTVVNESSSKGNQLKFYNSGYWIKLDSNKCHQGLAEEFVSLFESCIVGFNFVPYRSTEVKYLDDMYLGCICPNMYSIDTQFLSLRRLLKQNNIPLNIFTKSEVIENNIREVILVVGRLTGLDITNYFRDLFYLDTLILNEDRHYMNLGVCKQGNRFIIAPCFDNGSSLFCVNWTYRRTKSLEENINSAKSVARPFSKFYDNQVQALQNIGVSPLRISKQGVDMLLRDYNNPRYDIERIQMIKSILVNRLNYYQDKGVFVYV